MTGWTARAAQTLVNEANRQGLAVVDGRESPELARLFWWLANRWRRSKGLPAEPPSAWELAGSWDKATGRYTPPGRTDTVAGYCRNVRT